VPRVPNSGGAVDGSALRFTPVPAPGRLGSTGNGATSRTGAAIRHRLRGVRTTLTSPISKSPTSFHHPSWTVSSFSRRPSALPPSSLCHGRLTASWYPIDRSAMRGCWGGFPSQLLERSVPEVQSPFRGLGRGFFRDEVTAGGHRPVPRHLLDPCTHSLPCLHMLSTLVPASGSTAPSVRGS